MVDQLPSLLTVYLPEAAEAEYEISVIVSILCCQATYRSLIMLRRGLGDVSGVMKTKQNLAGFPLLSEGPGADATRLDCSIQRFLSYIQSMAEKINGKKTAEINSI